MVRLCGAEVMAEKVLFVCLGNICRSPLAEAAFRRELKAIGLEAEADSAGIGDWHIGEAPDRRAQAVAKRNGIDISGYRARLVTLEDFRRFGHIVAMDRKNLAVLKAMRPADATAELSLLLDHVEGRCDLTVSPAKLHKVNQIAPDLACLDYGIFTSVNPNGGQRRQGG